MIFRNRRKSTSGGDHGVTVKRVSEKENNRLVMAAAAAGLLTGCSVPVLLQHPDKMSHPHTSPSTERMPRLLKPFPFRKVGEVNDPLRLRPRNNYSSKLALCLPEISLFRAPPPTTAPCRYRKFRVCCLQLVLSESRSGSCAEKWR